MTSGRRGAPATSGASATQATGAVDAEPRGGLAMTFAPIAVVGRSCVLPGALDPETLWRRVRAGHDLTSDVDAERWQVPPADVRGTPGASSDRTWSERGGYVRGFAERFDPRGFGLPADTVRRLDPVFQWTLHGVREALRDAGRAAPETGPGAAPLRDGDRTGLVMGNLSFPSAGMADWAAHHWLSQHADLRALGIVDGDGPDPRHRFTSGLPALLSAEALGLGAGALCLDAACASALYAIKLACDRLHRGVADTMVAGAVSAADDLFIHIGFCALSAMSRTGRSRPFHAGADGLVPGEGAAFVVLRRLDDAVAAGERILGVIRGVGLSNDGRDRGLLAPSERGQVRAMEAAWRMAGLSPRAVGLLECHATGTPVGDGTEVRSMAKVFAGAEGLPIGSLKSNMGHLITAAGAAGLLKVLAALEHGERPPTLHVDSPILDLQGSPFRLLTEPEPWQGPRRAAVSAFGFGGNNAHLIVEAWDPSAPPPSPPARPTAAVAVVAVGARVGRGDSAADLLDALRSGDADRAARADVVVDARGLRSPPRDLEQTHAQQLLVLEAAREAAAGLTLPHATTGVFVGMGADPEVARHGARWRLAHRVATTGAAPADPHWLAQARDVLAAPLQSARVVGTMPNVPANRIGSQLDLGGMGFTLSAEEASGLEALRVAVHALASGELDAALVGATDLSHDPAHGAALRALGVERAPGDAAVVLVLRRLDDAQAAGEPVLAVVSANDATPGASAADTLTVSTEDRFGHAHAATALVDVAAAALALGYGLRPHGGAPATPWLGARAATVETPVLSAERQRVTLRSHGRLPLWPEAPLVLRIYAGATRGAALSAARADAPVTLAEAGPARLVLTATEAELPALRAAALDALDKGTPLPPGAAFQAEALAGDHARGPGEVASIFTGAAAGYVGMGAELTWAFPGLVADLGARASGLLDATRWAFNGGERHPLDQLWGTTYLCQLHTALLRDLAGLTPDATLGYSSGETNALFAYGAWTDFDAMMAESRAEPLLTRDLAGDFAACRDAWDDPAGTWQAFTVVAPVDDVQDAVAMESHAHVTIINTESECVIGGESAAVARVVDAIGRERCFAMDYPMAAHCPEIEGVREAWWAMHHRQTDAKVGVRYYSNGFGRAFDLSADEVAEGITNQAVATLDLPRTIRQMWDDGVRVFVEHGPRNACSAWISRILEDRPHTTVALDRAGRDGVRQAAQALAALVAAGVPCDPTPFFSQLAAAALRRPTAQVPLRFLAHAPPVELPPFVAAAAPTPHEADMSMPPAPALPSMLADLVARPVGRAQPFATALTQPRAPGSLPGAPVDVAAPAPGAQVTRAARAPAARLAQVTTAVGVAGPRAVPTQRSGPTAALVAFQRQVADTHQRMMAEQAAVHGQFLALRQRALDLLLNPGAGPAPHTPRSPVALRSAATEMPTPVAAPVAAPAEAAATTPARGPMAATTATRPAAGPAARPTAAGSATATTIPPTTIPPTTIPPTTIPPTPAAATTATAAPTPHPGPHFSRAQLETLASGQISSVFGAAFADQDGYAVQVRMPMPPLLLADRVTGLDAVAHSMGKGTIWTETDVTADAWYLGPDGRMPGGVMIESGQADLLLISWLGADRINQGERAYRLLGCELAYHGELPKIGETLEYDIHIDGHARQGDVRLFFFHYDCRVNGELRLSVRSGQAGFFTADELAESGGVLWSPDEVTLAPELPMEIPATHTAKTALSRRELEAFAAGRPYACFGAGFELTQAHVFSPRIGGDRLLMLDAVTALELHGGPWQRGYLRATQRIRPDDWFFEGHFKNDPCMPGTLMFEGCLSTLSLHLAALGYTIDRDGWRFQPVVDQRYLMRCRGQVTPTSQELVYEVFVREVHAIEGEGPDAGPTLYADLLCTVDGLKAFHAKRVGMRLVPDWPLGHWRHGGPHAELTSPQVTGADLPGLGGLLGWQAPTEVAEVDGFSFDYQSLLACAWGRPSDAFGPFYQPFDSARRVARLPGPPYHFMTRITRIDTPMGGVLSGQTKAGGSIQAAYDIPDDAWYFAANASGTMPLAVLMEAALQPCGWFASFMGCALTTDIDLLFRNLDGTGTLHREVTPGSGPLVTDVTLTNLSQTAGMIIVSFAVSCRQQGELVYDMSTVFGFFPTAAFENQAGLPAKAEVKAAMTAPGALSVDLAARPARYCAGSARLAEPMLLMLDRITDWQPEGGKAGLGRARAEKAVDPAEWFFKAHFFQDPVQPGSLGIEAMAQLLQWTLLELGLAQPGARFEALMTGQPLTWKYRGQVVPSNGLIQSELELTEVGEDERGVFAIADCSLWVDGKRIYEAKGFGMRLVPGDDEPGDGDGVVTAATPEVTTAADVGAPEQTLSLEHSPWLGDHRPTWTAPTLPMMSMVDLLAAEAHRRTGVVPAAVRDVRALRWLRFDEGPQRVRVVPRPASAHDAEDSGAVSLQLEAWRDANNPALSRFEAVATGIVETGDVETGDVETGDVETGERPARPAPWPALAATADTSVIRDAYGEGRLFHGPAFQAMQRWRVGAAGASAVVDAGRVQVPRGALNQGLLDVMTHVIPHDGLGQWSAEIAEDLAAYPHRVVSLRTYEPLPSAGMLRLEARFVGCERTQGAQLATTDVQLLGGGESAEGERVLASLRLEEILLPKGRIGTAPLAARRRFVAGLAAPQVALSTEDGGVTSLARGEVRTLDWLPGTVAQLYGVAPDADADALAVAVAAKEHVARRLFTHPRAVQLRPERSNTSTAAHTLHAVAASQPFLRHTLAATLGPAAVQVRDVGGARRDFGPARRFWRQRLGRGSWPVESLFFGLIDAFVRDVVVLDPAGLAALGRPDAAGGAGPGVIYLANHQVAIESLLFSVLAPALTGRPVCTVAKDEHRQSHVGRLIAACFAHPEVVDPGVITFFNRDDPGALLGLAERLGTDLSAGLRDVMVHAAGTRATAAAQPVTQLAGTFLDLALATGAAIVPVRFVGGLPAAAVSTRLDFPVGLTQQDIWVGQPIPAARLAALPLKERRAFVLHAMNHLGPDLRTERAHPANPALQRAVRAEAKATDDPVSAVLRAALRLEQRATRRREGRALADVDALLAGGPFADTEEGRWLGALADVLR